MAKTKKAAKQVRISKATVGKGAGPRRRVTSRMKLTKGTLTDWFADIRQVESTERKSGAQIGACHLSNPAGGPAMCVMVDRKTCGLLKGRFLGGTC